MKRCFAIGAILFVAIFKVPSTSDFARVAKAQVDIAAPEFFPKKGAQKVNPDAVLKLTFATPPKIGTTGKIRIVDAANDKLVDELDMSIPAGPTKPVDPAVRAKNYLSFLYPYERTKRATNRETKPGTPSAGATPTSQDYQLTIIGGFTDGFRFHPITVDGNTATIHPHHDMLEFGKRYYVVIERGMIDGFEGIAAREWTFSTKKSSLAPKTSVKRIVVSADGTGDFDTLQGALDFMPDKSRRQVRIYVKRGIYEEIVYVRNKTNVTIIGEDRDSTIVRYANNEVFNPHPANIRTNPEKGTFPSRRAAVTIDNCDDIQIFGITFQTTLRGQAEGLLINGERNILQNVKVIGSGDALQANGSIYMRDSTVIGDGDTILGRGTLFCERCRIESKSVFMWPRNKENNHGNVFINSTFVGTDKPTTIARAPQNGEFKYPYAEVVLIDCTLDNIAPEGWGAADDGGNVRFLEFNSRNVEGKPVDTAKRAAWSRRLDSKNDAATIASYRRPEFVFGGWKPRVRR